MGSIQSPSDPRLPKVKHRLFDAEQLEFCCQDRFEQFECCHLQHKTPLEPTERHLGFQAPTRLAEPNCSLALNLGDLESVLTVLLARGV